MAIMNIDYYSVARRGFVSFNAILPVERPPMADQPPMYVKGPFPTLYLLHGFSGNRNDWITNTRIAELASQRGYAVVMPDARNNFYLDVEESLEYCGEFVGRELVEVTRSMFPLSQRREDTVIGGISMGGFGAVRNGLKYADTFGAILSHSAALITNEVANMTEGTGNHMAPYAYYRHTFGDLKALLGSDKDPMHLADERVKDGTAPKLFLACGTEDFLFEHNTEFHAHLDKIGYAHTWWTAPGVHDYDFWNASLPASLDWLDAQRGSGK